MLGEDRKAQAAVPVIVLILLAVSAYGGWYLYWREDPGNRPIPPGAGGIEETVDVLYVKMDVEITSPTWDWNDMNVDILDHSISRKIETIPMGIMLEPFLFTDTYNGVLTVRIKNSSGVVSDEFSKNFELDEGLIGTQDEVTIPTDWLKVGQVSSGQYTVEARVVDDTGDVVVTDEIIISS